LRWLGLRRNAIGDAGASALSEAMRIAAMELAVRRIEAKRLHRERMAAVKSGSGGGGGGSSEVVEGSSSSGADGSGGCPPTAPTALTALTSSSPSSSPDGGNISNGNISNGSFGNSNSKLPAGHATGPTAISTYAGPPVLSLTALGTVCNAPLIHHTPYSVQYSMPSPSYPHTFTPSHPHTLILSLCSLCALSVLSLCSLCALSVLSLCSRCALTPTTSTALSRR
jgi:hypothetical protein